MSPERWEQIKEVLQAALELQPEARSVYLDRACSTDHSLRQEVESLLAESDHIRSSFLQSPPIGRSTLVQGTSLGPYEIVSLIGAGGMGEVYRARDLRLRRDVAIKVLPSFVSSDKGRLRRFEQEAQAAAALNHPNILAVHQMGTYEGAPYLVSELLEGETLREEIRRGPLPARKAIDQAVQIARGLAVAHGKGIAHRDLKPENLFVTKDGRVKILDFGLAKLTEVPLSPEHSPQTVATETAPGMVMGTVGYMSPEQVRGEEVDTRADLFSFGVVLYEMATGRPAFPSGTPAVIFEAILNREPTPPLRLNPALPSELERIIGKALEKDRDMRYQTAADLCADLRRLQRDLASGRVEAGNGLRSRQLPGRKPKAVPASIKAIAVLPLTNLSRDPEQDYFNDGMTEALITDLAQIGALRVISRTSAMRYKGSDKPLAEIARELNVDGLVEGSVLRVGDRVRISAQLIHATTDQHVWAKSYERDLRDVLALQKDVARAIAEEVQIKLTPQERARLVRRRPVNPLAHEAYLKGRYYWAQATEASVRKSVEHFEEAIAKDPSYAPAYCGLSDAYNFLCNPILEVVPPSEAMPKAKAVTARALELDDMVAEAYISLGRISFYFDWAWAGAEKSFRRAIELNPNLAYAHSVYALLLSALRRPTEAIREAKLSQELDPVSLLNNFTLGAAYTNARQFAAGEEQFRRTLELDPAFGVARWMLSTVLLFMGRYDESIGELEKAVTIAPNVALPRALLGWAYAKADRRDEALRVLNELTDLAELRYVTPMAWVLTYIGMGDERVFEALEEAYQQRSPFLVWTNAMGIFDELQGDSRFQDVLRRMEFPQSVSPTEQP